MALELLVPYHLNWKELAGHVFTLEEWKGDGTLTITGGQIWERVRAGTAKVDGTVGLAFEEGLQVDGRGYVIRRSEDSVPGALFVQLLREFDASKTTDEQWLRAAVLTGDAYVYLLAQHDALIETTSHWGYTFSSQVTLQGERKVYGEIELRFHAGVEDWGKMGNCKDLIVPREPLPRPFPQEPRWTAQTVAQALAHYREFLKRSPNGEYWRARIALEATEGLDVDPLDVVRNLDVDWLVYPYLVERRPAEQHDPMTPVVAQGRTIVQLLNHIALMSWVLLVALLAILAALLLAG
jgi:hypothetical protein